MNLKNNTKIFVFLVTMIMLCNTSLNASKKRGVYATKNLVGQEYYMKRCSFCHGEATRGGNMASIREWKSIFSGGAKELISLHSDDDESIEVTKYINNEEFKKESILILPLLQEFAYDSENIPTCN